MNRLTLGHFDGHRSTAPPHVAQDSVKKKDHGAHLRANTQGHYDTNVAGAWTL